MFTKILLPVDGSSFGEHALPYAVAAAKTASAELQVALVHVRHTPASTDPALVDALAEWDDEQARREADYLHALAARASDDGVRATPLLLRGDVIPTLEAQIRKQHHDLVVMTSHGRAGVERAWLGSVADALIRHVEVPILVVRPGDAEPASHGAVRYRHVLIALDGSERAERALRPALNLAGGDTRATLLRVVAPPSAVMSPYLPHAVRYTHEELESRRTGAVRYLDEQAARLRERGFQVETSVLVDYHAARAILQQADELGVDLIALSTHGRSPAARLVMGSVTDKVVRAANVPVLVC